MSKQKYREAEALRIELHNKIDHADQKQLEQLYGIISNYLNGHEGIEEWDRLTDYQKQQIEKGLAQSDAGMEIPAKEVIRNARAKYGLNG